jgi:CheY-like chemotaxis protein
MAKADDNGTHDSVEEEMAKPRISKSPTLTEMSMDTSRTPAVPSTVAPPNGAVAVGENNTPKRTVRILVADDHPTIMQMVKQILAVHSGFEVVGEARDGEHAVTLAEGLKPDVVVINVTMPKMSGFEAARRIRVCLPDCAIVILSSHKDQQFLAEAQKAGANGYVAKSDADRELVDAIESAVKGEQFLVAE